MTLIARAFVCLLFVCSAVQAQTVTGNVRITGNVRLGAPVGTPSNPDPDPDPITSEAPFTGDFITGVSLGTGSPTVNVNGVQLKAYADGLANGLSLSNGSAWRTASYGFTLTPTPEPGLASMLLGGVWREGTGLATGQGFRLSQTVGNGVYDFYIWSVENHQSNYRSYDLKLEGAQVATAIGELPLGRWQRYGPYRVTVTDGVLDIDVLKGSKGDPQIAGFALFNIPVFSKAVNLGTSAAAVTVDGNAWLSHSAAAGSGMTINSGSLYGPLTYSFTLSPSPTPAQQSVLVGGVYRENPGAGGGFSIEQTIASGKYRVYVWAIENYQSNYRDMTVKLEGAVAAASIGNLPVGGWARYGPYDTTVNDGKLTIDVAQATKGDPQINAFEVYKLYEVTDAVVVDPGIPDPTPGGDTPPSNAVSVANYGVNLADNSTDDRSAIIAAMNAVPAGGTLFFPAGVYNLTGSITMRCGINYMGVRTQSIIKQNSGFHIFQWFFPSACSDMLVSSLVFDVNGVIGVGTFGFESTTSNLEFRWNVFKNHKTDNVCCNDRIFRFVGVSNGIKVHHNIFGPTYVSTNAAGRGLGSLHGIFWQLKPSNIYITDNYFNKVGEPIHSYCDDRTCESASTVSNFVVSRNVFAQYQDIALEIQIHVKDTIIEDNWFGNIYNPGYTAYNVPGQPDTGTDGSYNGIDPGNMAISNAQGSDQNTRIARNIILGNWQKEDGTKGINGAGWGIEWSTGKGNPPGTFKSEIYQNRIYYFSRFGVDYGNGMQPTQGNNAPIFGRFNTFHDNFVCGGTYDGNYNANYAGNSQLASQGNTWAANCPQSNWDAMMAAYPPPPPPFSPADGKINTP